MENNSDAHSTSNQSIDRLIHEMENNIIFTDKYFITVQQCERAAAFVSWMHFKMWNFSFNFHYSSMKQAQNKNKKRYSAALSFGHAHANKRAIEYLHNQLPLQHIQWFFFALFLLFNFFIRFLPIAMQETNNNNINDDTFFSYQNTFYATSYAAFDRSTCRLS